MIFKFAKIILPHSRLFLFLFSFCAAHPLILFYFCFQKIFKNIKSNIYYCIISSSSHIILIFFNPLPFPTSQPPISLLPSPGWSNLLISPRTGCTGGKWTVKHDQIVLCVFLSIFSILTMYLLKMILYISFTTRIGLLDKLSWVF